MKKYILTKFAMEPHAKFRWLTTGLADCVRTMIDTILSVSHCSFIFQHYWLLISGDFHFVRNTMWDFVFFGMLAELDIGHISGKESIMNLEPSVALLTRNIRELDVPN